jgi:hypothetical protein
VTLSFTNSTYLAGLANTAHNNSSISTAVFSNVTVNGTTITQPAISLTSDGTHRPLTVDTLDNLGDTTAVSQYDGDTIALTNSNDDGVPDSLPSSLLGRLFHLQQRRTGAGLPDQAILRGPRHRRCLFDRVDHQHIL